MLFDKVIGRKGRAMMTLPFQIQPGEIYLVDPPIFAGLRHIRPHFLKDISKT
jgi:hypothetical protein